ncbi:MAG TPA: ChbG/HpnK family deacetylase, partial [Gammaproteobacteria bacterium]|nr:ChbG/HpnK family deacetylase [Gammaproteobacteria bacterium]
SVSCLTTAPHWPTHSKWLKSFQTQVDLGLHFNLTEGKPISLAYRQRYGESFFPLSRLISQAFLRKLDEAVLQAECQAQLDCFISILGFLPDFIDGHQHIHQLPQVRKALLQVYERSLRDKKVYLRSVARMVKGRDFGTALKQKLIYCCGALGFQKLLKQEAIPHNTDFAGVYSFSEAVAYPRILQHFLENIKDKGLIMCHPALEQKRSSKDPIAFARVQEYNYLASEDFARACHTLGIQLHQFSYRA